MNGRMPDRLPVEMSGRMPDAMRIPAQVPERKTSDHAR